MTRAWEIAREGVTKFGGHATDYIAEAMKIAWSEAREIKTEIVLAPGSRKHKSWLAKINGRHPQYKFDREFLQSDYEQVYTVANGLYEVQSGGQRYFIQVANGKYEVIQDWKAEELVS